MLATTCSNLKTILQDPSIVQCFVSNLFDQLSNILWTKNLIQLTLIVTINLKMTLNVLSVNNARKSETEMKMEFFEKSLFRGSYKSGKISQFSAAPHQLPNMRHQFYSKESIFLVFNPSSYRDRKGSPQKNCKF